jgi:hypothetical protein
MLAIAIQRAAPLEIPCGAARRALATGAASLDDGQWLVESLLRTLEDLA